jgi:UDP-N-acetyl-2-amino-2-deoxyglucuronate dehydrogenase
MYNCAVVGLGRGKSHVSSILSNKGARVAALCDINLSLANSHAKKVNEKQKEPCKVYTNYEEMIEKEKLDAVFLATPHYLHAPQTVFAADHEVNVFCEKPMAISLHECDQMITACRKNDVKLAIGYQHHYDVEFQYMRSAVQGAKGDLGGLGRITDILMTARHYRGEMYYLTSSQVDPKTGVPAGQWRGRWDTEGGGPLANQAIHNLDIFQFVAGPIRSLTAYGKNISSEHKFIEVEDTVVAIMELENGGMGSLTVTSSNSKGATPSCIHIHGTDGAIIGEGGYAGNLIKQDTRWKDEEDWDIPFPMENENRDQIHNFFWALDNDEDPLVTGEEGRKSIELMRAILKSIQVEGPVRFPLVDMQERPFVHNVNREKNLTL